MILQGVGHPISCLGVCYANDPKKGGYTTPAPALDLTTSLRGDFPVEIVPWQTCPPPPLYTLAIMPDVLLDYSVQSICQVSMEPVQLPASQHNNLPRLPSRTLEVAMVDSSPDTVPMAAATVSSSPSAVAMVRRLAAPPPPPPNRARKEAMGHGAIMETSSVGSSSDSSTDGIGTMSVVATEVLCVARLVVWGYSKVRQLDMGLSLDGCPCSC